MKDSLAIGIHISNLKHVVRLLRPHHWIKNSFLFIPLFFAGEFFNIDKVLLILMGFISFSSVASSIYIINDLKDIASDRNHPLKKNRPLASGSISKQSSLLIFSILIAVGFVIAYTIDTKFLFILILYFFLNIVYSFGLKNVSILDIFLVSIGFILRVKAGGAIADIYVTEWLVVMIFLLALFMAIAKRRDDVIIKLNEDKNIRKSISGYNLNFVTTSMSMILSVSMVAYLMYIMSPATELKFGTHRLYYTFLFVLAGVLRYLQIIYLDNDSGSPTKILYKDFFIQSCIILWILSFGFIIYYPFLKTLII